MVTTYTKDPEWWDQYGQVYPLLSRLLTLWASFDKVLTTAGIQDDSRVLDVGCGTGFLLRSLLENGLSPSVTGLDFSPVMLAHASNQPYDGPVEFHLADLSQPHDAWGVEGTFSHIVLINFLYAVADKAALLRQLSALAEPEAVMVISTPRSNPSMDAILAEHLQLFEKSGGDPNVERQELLAAAQEIIAFNQQLLSEGVTKQQLLSWFAGSNDWTVLSITTNYAGQNWLVKLKRARKR